jgi:anti-sigma factor RsiW
VSILRSELVCRDAVELMTDYLEGALGRRQRRRLERHLADCPHCRAYLEQLRATVVALGEPAEEPTDSATRDALLDLYRRYREDPGED